MTAFPTHAVLSASTGRLMGDIGGVYEVASFLLDRSAFTHELGYYSKKIAIALIAAHPELPMDEDFSHVTMENVNKVRTEWEARLGRSFELNDALKGVLADDRDPVDVLKEMKPDADIVVINTNHTD